MDLNALRELHFLRPLWLCALPPLLLGLVWLRWRQRRSGAWTAVLDAELLQALRLPGGAAGSAPWLLIGLAWSLCVVALAGPAWERLPGTGFRVPDAWVIVLDLSPSMTSSDVAPDRASRARYVIADLLSAAHDARVGLIAFAGEAHTVVPLTSDVATVRGLLAPLAPSLMPEAGDSVAPALEQALRLLRQSGSRRAKVILLTDGFTDPAQGFSAAQSLRAAGATVEVIGVGTPDGAPLKDAQGNFVHDPQGRSVLSKLPLDPLQRLAAAGGGRYWSIETVRDLIASLQARQLNPLDEGTQSTDQQVTSWRNAGIWLVPGIVLVVGLIARRGWL